jgi:seryl-tRNA synthetase
MHDPKLIREQPAVFDAGLKRRNLAPLATELAAMDVKRRELVTALQERQNRRNDLSRRIGQAKAKGEPVEELLAEVEQIKVELPKLEAQEREQASRFDARLAEIPNLPTVEVPEGHDETGNREIRRVGSVPEFAFEPKDHVALGARLGMDFARAAKISGARFVVLSAGLARLDRAIANFMLDLHTREFGYTEVAPPLLVRDQAAFGTGNLPKFDADLFRTREGYWLIPTAEVSLTNLVADEVLDEAVLPLRFVAWTPCFRSEAGAAGKDTHGMIRQHQFSKVELVSISHPDKSSEEHERMTACAEEVLRRLGLAFRTVLLCGGDMGFAAQKTYDIEVWLPGQGRYREISSCSNCGEFQARRMRARCKAAGAKGTRLVHTLNGSGLAVGRTLVALMENYQQADGSIAIPPALRPFMDGKHRLEPTGV